MEIQRIKATEQDRKLVSDFIGVEYPEEIDFNWLMPVIEKIETLVIKTNITSNIVTIRVNEDSFYDIVVNFKKENKTKIEGVWQAVIQFITWYNNTQTKKQ